MCAHQVGMCALHACEHTCGGKRTVSGVTLQVPFFETRPLPGLELIKQAVLGSLCAKGISLSMPLQHRD